MRNNPLILWVAKIWATFFYTGLSPIAPGTAGTLATIPFYYFLLSGLGSVEYFGVLAVLTLTGILASHAAIGIFKKDDPGEVVIDEVCGYVVTMALLPVTWVNIILGFFLFRAFDIIKPPPARQFESFPGGIGIVADDLMAGIYANLVLQILNRLWA